jgi:hypothetical protein
MISSLSLQSRAGQERNKYRNDSIHIYKILEPPILSLCTLVSTYKEKQKQQNKLQVKATL